MNGLLSLKWNSHCTTVLKKLRAIYSQDVLCDVTIACHGKFYPVHKLVLSICSEYFEEIFKQTHCKHPFIIMRDIKPIELEALLSYMYNGEVNVSQEMLPGLISAAESLKIIGLAISEDKHREEEVNTKKRKYGHLKDSDSSENQILHKFPHKILPQTEKFFPNSVSQYEINKKSRMESMEMSQELDDDYKEEVIKTEPIDSIETEDVAEMNGSCLNQSNPLDTSSETLEDGNISIKSHTFIQIKEEREQDFSVAQCSSWDNALNTSNENALLGEICETIVENFKQGETPDGNSNQAENISRPREEFECSYCPFKSFSKLIWRQHCSDEHPGNQLFRCKLCKYQTSLKYLLNRHMYVHNGEKKFKCDLCSYKTAYSFNMKTHYHKHNINFSYKC